MSTSICSICCGTSCLKINSAPLGFFANHPKAIVADFGCGTNLMDIQLFDEHSRVLCVYGNFLMHLSAEELDAHFAYVACILKPGGAYIFATLNPAYEQKKIADSGILGEIKNGDRYDFMHGKAGEHGTFYHYYKTPEFWQETIEKYFTIESKEACRPISDAFRESHGRYYEGEAMAEV